MTQIPLGSGFYQSVSPIISNQLCTNWYPNYPQSTALASQSLIPTPGIELLTTTTTANAPSRGGIVFNGQPYQVNGNILYRIDEIINKNVKTYEAIELGTIVGEGRVSLSKNNTQICIVVPNSVAYIFSEKTGLVEITDTGFLGPANVVVYLGGYFIFATETLLFASNLNDGLNFNALDNTGAEVDPDNIVTLHVYKNQLYVLGVDTTEVFENVGNPTGFPLQRVEGFIIDKGVVGAFAVADFQDSFVFVGSGVNEQPAVWRVRGSEPEKISSTAVDTAIDQLTATQLASTIALSYAQEGAYFAIFSFIEDTFAFDSTASTMAERPIWHKRESIIGTNTQKWRVISVLEAYGRLIVGDTISADIGALNLDLNQEYGVRVSREWSSPPIAKEDLRRIFLKQLMVTVDPGLASSGDDPILRMSISDDGGKTYSNEVGRSMGLTGERDTLMIWNRLGSYTRYFNVRLRFSGDNRCVMSRIDAMWA
jgi:hypothetical protein